MTWEAADLTDDWAHWLVMGQSGDARMRLSSTQRSRPPQTERVKKFIDNPTNALVISR
jgi:hypothetical protein